MICLMPRMQQLSLRKMPLYSIILLSVSLLVYKIAEAEYLRRFAVLLGGAEEIRISKRKD